MKRRFKILFITDSLAFPRAEPEFVHYDETYLALLKREFPDYDFIHQGRGGATIIDLYKHTAYFHGTLDPDMVVIQAGIVDCAPRALTVMEQHIISRMPLFNKSLTRVIKKYAPALRRIRKMTYTPIPVFQAYVQLFETLFPGAYWIGALPVSAEYEAKVTGVAGNVQAYNDVLRKWCFVDTSLIDPETMIMTDHHHLNKAGHAKMFEILAEAIRARFATTRTDAESFRLMVE